MSFDFDEAFRAIDRQTKLQEEVFRPSRSIPELILKLQCGWSAVLEAVKFMRFHDLGQKGAAAQKRRNDPPVTKGHLIPGYLDKLAKKWQVNFNAELFAEVVARVAELRNRFAHMLYIESVEGEWPNREIAFWIVPLEESVGFRDETWSEQKRQRHVVSEQEMRDALAETEGLLMECRRLDHAIGVAREFARDGSQ